MMRMGLGMVAILAPLQAVIGDLHGLNTAQYQPAKVAAMEAHWDGSKPGDLVLFAIPNEKEERNDYEIAIPGLASLIITHDSTASSKASKISRPGTATGQAGILAFRAMVGIGLVMIAMGFVGAFLWGRGKLFATRGT